MLSRVILFSQLSDGSHFLCDKPNVLSGVLGSSYFRAVLTH